MSQRIFSYVNNSQLRSKLFRNIPKRIESSFLPINVKISAFSSLSSNCVHSPTQNVQSGRVHRPSLGKVEGRSLSKSTDYKKFGVRSFYTNSRICRAYSTYSGSRDLLDIEPNEFVKFLKEKNIQRCYMVHDPDLEKPVVSHRELQEFAEFFAQDKIDYRQHEGVFMEIGPRSNCLLGAFVWNTNRGQACGGIRLWQYTKMETYIRDGLRLAFGMGVKSALAGLWAGGGKGVVAEPLGMKHLDPEFREKLFYDYGELLSSLNGCYVAAEDVGLNVADLNNVHLKTRYTTCIGEDLGGSGNPSIATGKGVVSAMEGAIDFLDMGSLNGKTVAIQGAGNVAVVIIEELLERGVGHIYVSECNQLRLEDAQDLFRGKADGRLTLMKVPLDDTSIMEYDCDILSPCALGNCLNKDTIPKIGARIICGAANNQLGCDDDNQLLADRNITYVVDFLANRMGIVNCANEAYGRLPDDPAIDRHFTEDWENSIYHMTKKILQKAEEEKITPHKAAMEIAAHMSRQLHPIWPNRSQKIIRSLVDMGWHRGDDYWRSSLNHPIGSTERL
ncbi:leucine dehydrogenase-like [Lineus longissimus]|uniref:leucine dehydrogenase-like n=1 Tax=Lineus longissimus TaxID=88925 RepID=UPI00315C64FE